MKKFKHPKVLSESGNELFFDEQGYLIKEEPKQETLEEVAEEFYSEQSKAYEDETEPMFDTSRYLVAGFISGAKWQIERSYSEEQVELIANEMVNWAIDNIGNPNPQSGKKFDEVMAKFKNK